MAFDAAERKGRFGRIQYHRSKESSSSGKKKRGVLLGRRIVRVEAKNEEISRSKIEGAGSAISQVKSEEWEPKR